MFIGCTFDFLETNRCRRVGIYHGRPLSILSKDVDAEMPTDRPDIMPSSPTNVAHMLATLRLNQALGKIAHEMYALALF